MVWGEVGRGLRFDPFIWAVLTLIYNLYFILVFILYIFYREYTKVLLLLLLLLSLLLLLLILLLFCYSEFCYDASIQMSNSDGLSGKKIVSTLGPSYNEPWRGHNILFDIITVQKWMKKIKFSYCACITANPNRLFL